MDWAEIFTRALAFALAVICVQRAMVKIKRGTYDDPMFGTWVVAGIGFITVYVKMAVF